MDPLSISLLLGAGTSLITGLMSSVAAGNASKTQADAFDKAIKYQKGINDQTRADLLPWMQAGKTALTAYMGELGLGGSDFQSKFKTQPGYEFQVQEGEKGVVNNLRALGMGASGAALKSLTKFRMGLADSTYQTYLDRLSGQSVNGQTQAAQMGAAANQNASGIAGNMVGRGAAVASGGVGAANAWSNSLGNFANNAGGYLGQYNSDWSRIAA